MKNYLGILGVEELIIASVGMFAPEPTPTKHVWAKNYLETPKVSSRNKDN